MSRARERGKPRVTAMSQQEPQQKLGSVRVASPSQKTQTQDFNKQIMFPKCIYLLKFCFCAKIQRSVGFYYIIIEY